MEFRMHHIERHSTDSTLWISSMAGLQLRHVPSKYLVSKYLESKYIVSTYIIQAVLYGIIRQYV